jgi:hypothetical protein
MPWNATSRGEIFVIDEDASMRENMNPPRVANRAFMVRDSCATRPFNT